MGVIVVLAGGTGGAKLARGMLSVVGPERLAVVANTGDDAEVYGVHVSPDPDLVTYWLADLIDERGFGIRGDTWAVMEALAQAGRPTWFRLGDRDLAMCLVRTEALQSGATLTAAHAQVTAAAGVRARVIPMSDDRVRTRVRVGERWLPFQEFMILERGAPPEGIELEGIEAARPAPAALEAIGEAEAIVIGPSNPVASIGPILAVPGMREAIAASAAPVVAVSPWVGGRVLKGPTDAFSALAGLPRGAEGVAAAYADLVDAVVADDADRLRGGPAGLRADTLMADATGRERLARTVLDLAADLRR